MKNAEEADAAAERFKGWIDSLDDNTVPVFVFCHMPLHYARGDNAGAEAWNRALNYAATGTETTQTGGDVARNVIYCYGHNHTVEAGKDRTTGDEYSGEFYIPCGASMKIGPQGAVNSNIYYTYVTDGYLKKNTAATLIGIGDSQIEITKYQNGAPADLYDTKSKKSGAFASEFLTGERQVIPRTEKRTHIRDAKISGLKASYSYSGKTIAPDIALSLEGSRLTAGEDYSVAIEGNKNAGTAKITITGKGPYYGVTTKTFKITKASNPLTIKPKTASVKYSKLRKKSRKLAVTRVIRFTKKLSDKKNYSLSSARKGSKSFKKYFRINKTTGKVTVKKGLKKGTYKVRVKVKALGNANYKASALKTVTFRVRVR